MCGVGIFIAANICAEGLAAMRVVKRLVLVGAALSIFAASFSALAEDQKKPTTAPAGQMSGKPGKTNTKDSAKDLASKGLAGKGGAGSGADVGGGVGGAVGDTIGGSVGSAVGGALGGFIGSIGH